MMMFLHLIVNKIYINKSYQSIKQKFVKYTKLSYNEFSDDSLRSIYDYINERTNERII